MLKLGATSLQHSKFLVRHSTFFCFYPHFTYICINKMNQQKGAATAPFSFLVWQTKQKYSSWKNFSVRYWQKNRNISWYPCVLNPPAISKYLLTVTRALPLTNV